MELIPTSVCLTVYGGGPREFMETPLDEIAQKIADGSMEVPIKTYTLDQIIEAYQAMEDNTAGAKMVVLV